MEELLSLKWNNHRSTFLHILGVLRDKQSYTDVTIACDGKFYSVHKLVLSTCSDYFCAMFEKTACKSPVIVLKDIKSGELEALLDYMYLGEVNVRQSDLASLIKAAENLRIKGLAVPDDEPPSKKGSVGAPSRRDGGCGSPPAKRKRRDESEDGREDVRPIPTMLPTPPPPSRPKSPVIQRLSPSPHRTQDSSSTEEHSNRPHSSPAEPSASSLSTSQAPQPSGNDQYSSDETLVKVEMEDEAPDTDGPEYNVNADGYKEEDDSSGAINNDLPEFLQAAASGTLSSSTSFSHPSFAGPSSYQPGDLAGWQGDVSSMGFPSHLNFSASDSSSQQNAPGRMALASDSGSRGLSSLRAELSQSTAMTSSSSSSCSFMNSSSSRASSAEQHPQFSQLPFHPPPHYVMETTVQCEVCGRAFSGAKRRFLLERHVRIHTGERPFRCPYCPLNFTQSGNLSRHCRRAHTHVSSHERSTL
ncbi:protein tramtrack, alpha isoform-like isoform X9 [Palaemon carinicauda]|uniref:protein tramtrack, alpha isoform-like isoform X9 n=1 Tax=Palaemon carinicauda TaxID=392227 RepID=UPI0035B5A735